SFDSLKKIGVKNQAVLLCHVCKHCADLTVIKRISQSRGPRTAEQNVDVTTPETLHNFLYGSARNRWRKATPYIIGAKLNDDRISALWNRSIQSSKSSRGRVAGDAGIDDLHRNSFRS